MALFLSVTGQKGSGKSELLEGLIARLKQRGLRIGVVKRMRRDDLEIDQPGKDTYRYRMSGADTVILAGRERLALFRNLREEIPLGELLNSFEGFDLVLLQDYFVEGIPRIDISTQPLETLISQIEERLQQVV